MTQLTDYIGAIISGVDLASVPTISNVTITNTGGTDAIILDATTARAGVMTKAQVDKLNSIAPNANNYTHPSFTSRNADIDTGAMIGATVISDLDLNIVSNSEGHVTSAFFGMSTRQITLSDIGYTGAPNANFYIHPSFTARNVSTDSGSLSGATVISRVVNTLQSNAEGHVTSASTTLETRNLTAADIGAAPAGAIPVITSGSFTPTFIGATGGAMSGTVRWVNVGGFLTFSGQIRWTTNPTGGSQVKIGGFPYTPSNETGFGFSGNFAENNTNAGNGMFLTMYANASDIVLWGYNENGNRSITTYNNLKTGGSININFSYYSASAPQA